MNDNTVQKLNMAGAAGAGLGTYILSNIYGNKLLSKYISNNFNLTTTPQDVLEYRQAIQNAIQAEGFDSYGLKILDCSKQEGIDILNEDEKYYLDKFNKKLKNAKTGLAKYLIKKFGKRKLQKKINYLDNIRNGGNAYAAQRIINGQKTNVIMINMEKFPSAVFHELGHHKNHRSLNPISNNLLYGILRNNKYIKHSLRWILLITLFTNNNKNPNPYKSNPFYPVGKFIKDNCAILAGLVGIPLLAEETMASIHGQIMGKKYLPKTQWKSMTKTHTVSFLSYAKLTAMFVVSMFLAKLARDGLVSALPKLQKIKSKYITKKPAVTQYNQSYNRVSMNDFLNK